MSDFVRTEIAPPVAILTIENPPVNALTAGAWEAIEIAIADAAAHPEIEAIVLMGAGQTFVAGADINIFNRLKTPADAMARSATIHALLRRIEDTPKPLVAAIHGHALGGGLELAMACHFRVATNDAKLGQPEVLLGIIPGAGGTQRLPRLCGVEVAVRLCTEGRPIDGRRALEVGLVDDVVTGNLRAAAIEYAKAKAAACTIRKTRAITLTQAALDGGLSVCASTRAALAKTARHRRAPLAVVDAIEAGLRLSFDDGSIRERELFAECVVSTESRALRHLFFAERDAAKLPADVKPAGALDIQVVGVVGAGTMGTGIAMAYANAGFRVILKDVDGAALERGLATIRRSYESAVAKGRFEAAERDKRLALIAPTTNYDTFSEADIVVEAVFEDLTLKERTFAEFAQVTSEDCVLATNTSTLDVDVIAAASGRPGQVVGHHFFSPAHIMTLLEIVRGRHTSPVVLATSLQLAKRLGKTPVIVGNCFGFVANRMLGYYLREALLLVEEGATVQQVDGVMTAFGLPVGPFAMEDIAGIDVGARIRQHRAAAGLGWAEGPRSPLPDVLYALGRYGQKTGAGWYRYESGNRERIPDPVIEELAHDAARARGIQRGRVYDDEILARITTALANEGLRVLEEGFAQRAGDIDVVYCHGFGFPRDRGGPMFYAHTIGLPLVLERVREYRSRLGAHWEPAALLERLVAEDRALYQN